LRDTRENLCVRLPQMFDRISPVRLGGRRGDSQVRLLRGPPREGEEQEVNYGSEEDGSGEAGGISAFAVEVGEKLADRICRAFRAQALPGAETLAEIFPEAGSAVVPRSAREVVYRGDRQGGEVIPREPGRHRPPGGRGAGRVGRDLLLPERGIVCLPPRGYGGDFREGVCGEHDCQGEVLQGSGSRREEG